MRHAYADPRSPSSPCSERSPSSVPPTTVTFETSAMESRAHSRESLGNASRMYRRASASVAERDVVLFVDDLRPCRCCSDEHSSPGAADLIDRRLKWKRYRRRGRRLRAFVGTTTSGDFGATTDRGAAVPRRPQGRQAPSREGAPSAAGRRRSLSANHGGRENDTPKAKLVGQRGGIIPAHQGIIGR